MGLVWDSHVFVFDGYESFKFKTAMISEIYKTTEKSRMEKSKMNAG